MPELIPTATEAEWLEARRLRITASEIAVVMGLSPYDSPYSLYHRKLGNLPPVEDTAAMERGRVLEPYIAEKFAERHPEFRVTGDGRELYAHPERDWMAATPDRLLCDWRTDPDDPLMTAVLECKVDGGSPDWGEEGTDVIPVHYRAQVIWQCSVMGVSTAYVACLNVARWQVREYVVEMDDAARDDLTLMLGEARDFLDRIDSEEPPGVDWRPATAAALKALYPSLADADWEIPASLASRYRSAVAKAKAAEQKKRLYENQIRARIGDARRATSGGEVIARRDVYEVREHVRKASTVDKLVPVFPKAAKENHDADSE